MLQGQKVLLRPVKRADIEYFLKWLNDPEVIQYLTPYWPLTEMSEEKWIENLGVDRDKVVFMVEALEGSSSKPLDAAQGTSIGYLALHNISAKDHNASFEIAIGEKDYWSSGYGTEAARLLVKYGFEQLNLHRINSGVYAFNERSLRMHRKVGFKEEGRQKEWIFKNGKFHDHVIFGILGDDWRSL